MYHKFISTKQTKSVIKIPNRVDVPSGKFEGFFGDKRRGQQNGYYNGLHSVTSPQQCPIECPRIFM